MRRRWRAQRAAPQPREVGAFEEHVAGVGFELQDRAAGGRFAAARFAHQAQRLAALHVEADAVDGAHGADLALKDDAAR